MKRISVFQQQKPRIIMIGHGMASFKFCQKFVKYNLIQRYDLVVFGEEVHPAYDRVNLTNYIGHDSAEKLYSADKNWYEQHNIGMYSGDRVIEINKTEKWIKTLGGKHEQYDKLILATGSFPFVPDIEGVNTKGVFVYRTIEDLKAIKQYFPNTKKAIVVGGGLLGLEAARALNHRGIKVTVVEAGGYIMSRQLDATGAAILQTTLEQLGLDFRLSAQVAKIIGEEIVTGVELSDKTLIATEMVIFAAGIRSRDELGKSAGLNIGPKGGIVTNEYHLTSDENIYAIGECAIVHDKIWGLAAPSFEMAEVLAARLKGVYKVFFGDVPVTKLKISETKLVCFGDGIGETTDCKTFVFHDPSQGIYKKINVSADSKYLIGAILIGDTSSYPSLLQLARNKTKLSGNPQQLLENSDFGHYIPMIRWPENTQLCLCEEVTIGNLLTACQNKEKIGVDMLQSITSAGTGCENCVPLLEQFVEEYNENVSSIKS